MVWVWGPNSDGELGIGDLNPRDLPAPVLSIKGKKITQVNVGGSSIICLG